MTQKYIALERVGAFRDELEALALGSLRRAVFDGDTQTGSVMAGQICGLIREIRTVQEVIDSMFEEAQQVRARIVQAA